MRLIKRYEKEAEELFDKINNSSKSNCLKRDDCLNVVREALINAHNSGYISAVDYIKNSWSYAKDIMQKCIDDKLTLTFM